MSTVSPNLARNLTLRDRVVLGLLFTVLVSFGAIVVFRGAFLHTRMTDLAVFLRAAWAIRTGADLYKVTDERGLKYHYPPLLAILLVPLADPPPGGEASGTISFAAKVALWYYSSLLFLALGLHSLAGALEQASPVLTACIGPPGSRQWWTLRVLPVITCLPALLHALSFGQVNVLWLALICAMGAAVLRGQPWRAGLWLAGAICLKVLPVFLLIYPVWRRDWRCLGGCALGLVLGIGAIPAATIGPARTVAYGTEWAQVLLLPAFGLGSDRTRHDELLGINSTRNQALMPVIHRTLHLNRSTRPAEVSAGVRAVHWALGGALTGITLLSAGGRRNRDPLANLVLLGALNVNMILLSPAGHPHYLVLLAVLVMGLIAVAWNRNGMPRLGLRLKLLLVLNVIASGVPLLPGMGVIHDLGMPMYAALMFWLAAILSLRTFAAQRVTEPRAS